MTGVLAGLALCVLLAGADAAGDLTQGLLCVLPAVLLLVALAFGYAPGEARLVRLRERRRRSRPSPVLVLAPRSAPRSCAGGGRLLALSLATRPPPRAATLLR